VNPFDGKVGGLLNRSGRRGEEKNLAPHQNTNSDPSAIEPVVSRYTDGAIPFLLHISLHNVFSVSMQRRFTLHDFVKAFG
jgi:hypothetical protein